MIFFFFLHEGRGFIPLFFGNYNIEKLTIDKFGHIEIPEKIHQQLGINNQTQLSLKVENDRLILQSLKPELETYYEYGILVFKAESIGNTEVSIQRSAISYQLLLLVSDKSNI